jgi:hypothetical protein
MVPGYRRFFPGPDPVHYEKNPILDFQAQHYSHPLKHPKFDFLMNFMYVYKL